MSAERIQEEEYDFPYHHLVQVRPFAESRHLFWGYQYAAYLEKVLETLGNYPFKSLIDIGCGDGKVLREIAHRFEGKRLVGVDYSEKSLRFARAFSPELTFMQSTDEEFECFVLIEVIEHIDPSQMGAFLDSISKNLAPGAIGIVTTPSDNVSLNPKHYQHFNYSLLEQTLSSHFEIVSLEYLGARTIGAALIQRLLANRFFILNERRFTEFLYSLYVKRYRAASENNASQLFAVVRKK